MGAHATIAGETTKENRDVEAEELLVCVHVELDRPAGEQPHAVPQLDARLRDFAHRLRARVRAGGEDPAATAALLEAIYEIGELRGDLRERDVTERLEVLTRIRESMEVLHDCKTPEQLIEAAPGEVCRALGFSRAMISRIKGSRWVPEVYEGLPHLDPTDEAFKNWIESADTPLEHMLVETEMVRRRMPVLIPNPSEDPRTWTELVRRGMTPAYVAAPIIPEGRPIGFFHADKVGQTPVTIEDRNNLFEFAEAFGLVYHRAVLVERLDQQRAQLHEAFGAAEAMIEELHTTELELSRTTNITPQSGSGALFRPAESRLDALLTRREREVLELITSGATNVRIAEQLVISEGTVKSHVKHILRKLRVGNRAEAVSRYLQILRRDQEHPQR
jgi:DNA-binding CsgD family transcriptional regulator